MKRHYAKMALIICSLVAFVYVLVVGLFTFVKVDGINKQMEESIEVEADGNIALIEIALTENNGDSYYAYVSSESYLDRMASEGATLYINTDGETNSVKLLVSEPFEVEPKPISIVTVDGMCDDNYFYNGTITYMGLDNQIHVYEVGENNFVNEDEAVHVEGEHAFELGMSWGRDISEHRAVISDYCAKRELGEKPDDMKFGILESYAVNMRPLETVLGDEDNVDFYFYATGLFVIAQIIVLATINRKYCEARGYELYKKRAVRRVISELEEPMANMKSNINEWKNAGDKDKDDYSQKICSEADEIASAVKKILVDNNTAMRGIVEEFNLCEAINNSLSKVKLIAKEANKKVEFEFSPSKRESEINIIANKSDIEMAISNMLFNALYGAQDKVIVRISELESKKMVAFLVRMENVKDVQMINISYETERLLDFLAGLPSYCINISYETERLLDANKAKYSQGVNMESFVIKMAVKEENK